MKYLLALLLLASCCAPRKATPQIKKDTTTGHWEYYDGSEDMRWIQNNEKHQK